MSDYLPLPRSETQTLTKVVLEDPEFDPAAYNIENPEFPLTDPNWANEMFGGATSTAGVRVSHANAQRYSPVWQALTMISASIAGMPCNLYATNYRGDVSIASTHAAHRLVRYRPNPTINARRFWRREVVNMLLWGAAYELIVRRSPLDPTPVELLPLLPDRTGLVYTHDGTPPTVASQINGVIHYFSLDDVLYFEGLSVDAQHGADLVTAARDAWGAGLAALNFASAFFRRGGRLGGILEIPATRSGSSGDKIADGFVSTYETEGAAFRTVILREGAKFHAAQATPDATQLVEARKESVRDVARFFNLAPSRLGENTGQSYNSKVEDNRDYLDTTLTAHMGTILAELDDKLLTDRELMPPTRRGTSFAFGYDTSSLLRLDDDKLMAYLTQGINATIISPNEARRILRMPGYEGGDEYSNPAITTKTKTATSEAGPGDTATEAQIQTQALDVELWAGVLRAQARPLEIFWQRIRTKARKLAELERFVTDGADGLASKWAAAVKSAASLFGSIFGADPERLIAAAVQIVVRSTCVRVEEVAVDVADEFRASELERLADAEGERIADVMLEIVEAWKHAID